MLRSVRFVVASAGLLTVSSFPAISAFAAAPASPPAVAAAPGATLGDELVDPFAAAIKAALADSAKRPATDKQDRAGLLAYYAANGYAPIWTADHVLSDRAIALIGRLKQADEDGLDSGLYATPDPMIGRTGASLEELARAEVMLSQSIIAYAHDAHAGRVDPNSISVNISYRPEIPDSTAVLANVTSAADPAAALASYNPHHPDFLALRQALATARQNAKSGVKVPIIPAGGPMMQLGATDPRVEILRARLGLTDPTEAPAKFDQAVQTAVKAFQKEQGLNPDGIVGQGTIAALNAAADNHIDRIIANMERWRWMPQDLGAFYVRVNIPNYNLEVYRDGKVIWTTRIVVGKPTNQTPIFSDEIEYAVVNPVWNVPSSIALKEMLPEILANPYRALAGYEVFYNYGGRFQQVNPLQIDWRRVDMSRIQIKQPPGEANALGVVKFMFPNDYSVYLHDTPLKSLFAYDQRAYSHGCMRVQDPWGFAEVLFSQEPGLTVAALKKMVGGPERQVTFANKIPVHITYFTTFVDASGKLQVKNDIYGHDAAVEKALGLQSV